MEGQTPANLFELQLDHETSSYLGETARWARFLSILGFIMIGFLVIAGVFFGGYMASSFGGMNPGAASIFSGGFITILYLLIALLYFLPCLYLYRFATRMRTALRHSDPAQLSISLKNLKSCFKFFGIMAIIVLGLYAIALIAAIVGSAVAH